MTTVKKKPDIWIRCDGCGTTSKKCLDISRAIWEAVKAGWDWRRTDNTVRDLCPDCQKKEGWTT